MEITKYIKYIHRWTIVLTIGWLVTTYEHNFYTLQKFTNHFTIELINWNMDWLTISSAALLVATLDLSIFFGVILIPYFKQWNLSITPVKWVLSSSTIISVALNIKYMFDAAMNQKMEGNQVFNFITAFIIGLLIPLMVVFFGWIEGNVMSHMKKIEEQNKNNKDDKLKENNQISELTTSNLVVENKLPIKNENSINKYQYIDKKPNIINVKNEDEELVTNANTIKFAENEDEELVTNANTIKFAENENEELITNANTIKFAENENEKPIINIINENKNEKPVITNINKNEDEIDETLIKEAYENAVRKEAKNKLGTTRIEYEGGNINTI